MILEDNEIFYRGTFLKGTNDSILVCFENNAASPRLWQ